MKRKLVFVLAMLTLSLLVAALQCDTPGNFLLRWRGKFVENPRQFTFGLHFDIARLGFPINASDYTSSDPLLRQSQLEWLLGQSHYGFTGIDN